MKVSYFQTIDGNPIIGATHIEEESLRTTLEDFVGLAVWQCERRTMTVDSDENMGYQGEIAWNVGLLSVPVCLSDRNIYLDNLSKAMEVFMRRGVRKEFSRNS